VLADTNELRRIERVDRDHETWPAVRVHAERCEGVGKSWVLGEILNDGDDIRMLKKHKFAIDVVVGKGSEWLCA